MSKGQTKVFSVEEGDNSLSFKKVVSS
ncbi:hypothetical protein E2C01_046555 [Portunus trituberculatus]|uniref:Uncharacterized protein n=1 Tax=Portunus trituberculatus TaxID=210409 RepID=A0A5B7G543_PORTR|nr:hypothetical protein [Portunus trituberculatus]